MKTSRKLDLDFSGGPNSWFDLWHTRVDLRGEGNADWKKRKKFIDELVGLYEQCRTELERYPGDYQLWISIDDKDSGRDAVYIHTRNPNGDNFPIHVQGDKTIKTKNAGLKKYLEKSDFKIIRYSDEDGDLYHLFDIGVGEPLG